MDEDTRVLSIQSWVAHGYVGNKCAVFALQHLGIEVDPINSVNLSNNTAYSSWRGESLPADKLWDMFQGLETNHLSNYSHVLTGYNNNAETLRTVLKIVQTLKSRNPNLIYVCDPVLGDNRALYVPENLVDIYKNEVIPNADYIFPNQTEAEFLTGIKINSVQDALLAIDKLHELGVKNIVITSLVFNNVQDENDILVIGSSVGVDVDSGKEKKNRFKIKVGPKFEGYYTGTGDLFSSLLLAWSVKEPKDLSLVCEKAVSTLYNVIKVTHEAKQKILNPKGIEYHELRLVQARKYIEHSDIIFKAELIN
ncbi:hypothetical protein CYY_008188 [Polysphondylium violaceum]|uniref:pyridoxal kinase n=1 Tax=Polysphondylium violaceum TaxID=133409 RepID=A0A8J4PNV5_9MYCE|nr:hypothetical protein CYY_008188 [Polysphondylium violaceum]